MDDDVKKAKEKLAEGARAVGRAAQNNAFLERRHDDIFGKGEEDWAATVDGIDDLDAEFVKEEMLNRLKRIAGGDVDVRVMEIGPDGKLTDVSDKVNPKDLSPDQIGGVQTGSGRTLLGRNPQSREAAMKFLQDILNPSRNTEPKNTTANSIRRMEAAIAEGDKILEHWKK